MTTEPATVSQPLIDVTGTARRLQALTAVGWTVTSIAQEAGISEGWARSIAYGHEDGQPISRAAADAVDLVFRQRCMTLGPSPLARSTAFRHGWVSALAWDDIDDPSEQPQGIPRSAPPAPGPPLNLTGRPLSTLQACAAWLRRASLEDLRIYVATGHRPGGTVDLRPAVLRLADAVCELERHTSTYRNAA